MRKASRYLLVVTPLILIAWDSIALAQGSKPTPLPTPPECSAKVYKSSDVDRKAKVKSYPHPNFSDTEVQQYAGSVIVLRGVFCASGQVTDLHVMHGVKTSMDEEAVRTAKRIKFLPAQKDGQNVSQWMQFEYHINVSWPFPQTP